jgi:hypothetical protein
MGNQCGADAARQIVQTLQGGQNRLRERFRVGIAHERFCPRVTRFAGAMPTLL